MENASKALIIAGAILLSILIIALGVFVFNQAKGAMSNTGLDDQKAAAFNQKFEAYEGKKVSGSQVKALIDIVRTNNNTKDSANADNTPVVTIKTSGCSGVTDDDWNDSYNLSTLKNAIASTSTYTVKITANYTSGATNGYVKEIQLSNSK